MQGLPLCLLKVPELPPAIKAWAGQALQGGVGVIVVPFSLFISSLPRGSHLGGSFSIHSKTHGQYFEEVQLTFY